MKTNLGRLTIILTAFLSSSNVLAQSTSEAAEEPEVASRYQSALEAAEAERARAEAAIQKARADVLKVRASERRAFTEAERAERAAMREELSRVHEDLRHASREVAQLHRELDRRHESLTIAPVSRVFSVGNRAVIGVVLGDSTDAGVPVLAVSPDGPAERAGLEQGDVIIAMMGEKLATDNEDPRAVLSTVMEAVKVGDELNITVSRDGGEQDFTVVADKREPFTWQSVVRLPSAPAAPSAPNAPNAPSAPDALSSQVLIERIDIPQIDAEALRDQVERMREDVEKARIFISSGGNGGHDQSWDLQFDSFSEFGDEALKEANVWFGLPVTKGLKLAEMDASLASYFKAERGVLVLKAKADNGLQLQSGDVILSIAGTEVNSPVDVMRALREWESEESIEIEIMRDRKNRELKVVLPERSFSFEIFTADEPMALHFSGD